MSHLLLKGEMMHCEKCGQIFTINSEGGPRYIQIGDFEVMFQLAYNEKFMPKDYDAETNGYFFHRIGLCEKCIGENIWYDSEMPFDMIENYLDNAYDQIKDIAIHEKAKFFNNLNLKYFQELNEECFERTINNKKFSITCFKERLTREFIEENRDLFIDAFKDTISNTNKYKKVVKKYIAATNGYEDLCKQIIENDLNEYYIKLDLDSRVVNLNSFIIHENTLNVRENNKNSVEFYAGPYGFPIKDIEEYFDLTIDEKFLDDEILFSYDKRDFFKPIELMILKC